MDAREQVRDNNPAMWRLLENLPHRHAIDDILLVHGSPRDPVMEYVLESDLWEGADPTKMDEIFEGFERLCFVGHTHRPGVFTTDRCFLPAQELTDGFDVSDGQYLINVGSVGQPRDRDPRSCYTVFSGDAVYFRRVEYDVATTDPISCVIFLNLGIAWLTVCLTAVSLLRLKRDYSHAAAALYAALYGVRLTVSNVRITLCEFCAGL